MKKNLLYLIFLLLNSFAAYSQEIMNNPEVEANEAIPQINAPRVNDILSFQTLNQGFGNFVSIHQAGNQNKAMVNQKGDAGYGFSNQFYNLQQGSFNEMTVGQIGNGNLMHGFQLGYLTNEDGRNKGNHFGYGLENGNGNSYAFGHEHTVNDYMVSGERNKLTIGQEGNNNGVMAVQQGSDNSLSAEQTGNNNYLLALQTGRHNSVTGYKQANESDQILFNRIIQVGDNLSLKADGASTYQPMANAFTQIGSNLALEVNNNLLNTFGGVEIKQTGRDMKVVVDQSYFSFQ